MSDYATFLATKRITDQPTGLADVPELAPHLFDFQRDIVAWALRRGRAAIFADCGMGKTPMQLEWAQHIPGRVLVVAPLAVSSQTVDEGVKFGVEVVAARHGADTDARIVITNYEMIEHFDMADFAGVVLDESSILKSHTGKYRTMLIAMCQRVPFRLCCTATPAPNDYIELGNHSEFLAAMTRTEMLSMFFVHDGGSTQDWRLKGHAETGFWQWLCSWAVMIRHPHDLGYTDGSFTLPPLNMHEHIVAGKAADGMLLPVTAGTMSERRDARKASVETRCRAVADMVNASDQPWLVWCDRNDESKTLTSMIPDAIEVTGSDDNDKKSARLLGFSRGEFRVMVTKPKIAGFGMNWQHCADMAFTGLSDSYEQFYQATRRCWRFGQERQVNVHVVIAETEGAVLANIKRKQDDAEAMADNMTKNMADITSTELRGIMRMKTDYATATKTGDGWTAHLGDCVDAVSDMPDASIHLSVFSPPFASLYTYSASDRDMGNCADADEFDKHFAYLVGELFRVTMAGRLCSFHCMNIPTKKSIDGYLGICDFRGDMIRTFERHGWIFHSEVCVWKDPVTQMQRTKSLGLLHKQVCKDSCLSRQGIPDYVVTMRKPGDNPQPVAGNLIDKHGVELGVKRHRELWGTAGRGDATGRSIELWQKYASPVWSDINASRTLQRTSARAENDERHISPLQLDVIERCVALWSNTGDTVLSPFMGIGSEGYVALGMGRRFVGVELKQSYYDQAVLNLAAAERDAKQDDLFAMAEVAQ